MAMNIISDDDARGIDREEEAKRAWLLRLDAPTWGPAAETSDSWQAPSEEVVGSAWQTNDADELSTSTLEEMRRRRAFMAMTQEQLYDRNSITEEPGKRGRFSRAWETLEKDANWLGFIGDRCLDALDDALFRSGYLMSTAGASSPTPSEEAYATTGARPRVVVLGSGWGANAVLSQLKNADVDVTVVSPRNYFLFTPMLAGAALGTLEPRSIIQPIREANPMATYFEAEATSVDLASSSVTCESIVCESVDACEIREFSLPYDQVCTCMQVHGRMHVHACEIRELSLPYDQVCTCMQVHGCACVCLRVHVGICMRVRPASSHSCMTS